MKVAVKRQEDRLRVVHFVWRLSRTGGIPNVVRNILARLDTVAHDQHVVQVRPMWDEDALDEFDDVTFHPLGFTGQPTAADRARLSAQAAQRLVSLRPDVVHLHSGTAMYGAAGSLASRAQLRILDVHDAPGSGRHGATSDAVEGMLCRRLRHVALAHSTSVQDDLRARYKLPDRHMRLVPLGVDDAHFVPMSSSGREWRVRHGLPADALVVLYVARLVPTKNVDLFLDVIARVISASDLPVHGIVVAGGSERDRISARIAGEGLGGRVHLLGPWTGESLVDAYGAADVFLSTSDYEGFGLAVVEAMAAGKPVVATSVGGVRDLVADGVTGHLVPHRDRDALVGRLLPLLQDSSTRATMGQAARARALEKFTVHQMAAGYARLYDEARQ